MRSDKDHVVTDMRTMSAMRERPPQQNAMITHAKINNIRAARYVACYARKSAFLPAYASTQLC